MKPTTSGQDTAPQLPEMLSVADIQKRLTSIFDPTFPNRGLLVGLMAARVVYVFLYGGFIDGNGRYLRPSHVYLFTDKQARKKSKDERLEWIEQATQPGFRPKGRRWYADTSRESIRDDLLRNQFRKRLGILHKLEGVPTTASTPVNSLDADFATLFDPALTGVALASQIAAWRSSHLDAATLQRMALRGQRVEAAVGDVFVDMPDGSRVRIAAGPSSVLVKAIIEEFATRHLAKPTVLWISASDQKSYPQFAAVAASVGLTFDVQGDLPDLILADMSDPIRFVLCEVVATDGAVTEQRREDLQTIIRASNIPEEGVSFLSAFNDRQAPALRKNFSKLALRSLVWFRTEPDLLVELTVANRAALQSTASGS